MTDTEFHQLVDKLMDRIEEQLDQYDGNNDIDCETHSGIMTLTFENDSKIIINRQEPLHQIWLATRSGGYHFNYKADNWYCARSKKNFIQILAYAISEQSGEPFSFDL
ncbi:iron donor protein CyaY [Arsenophonus nasoniae]|nr:iron donor protein CyaY [Arsenophonus nasoniae]QBY41707.1 Protein CyaY [Arsenophonus nasoniae]WGL95216.1 iron donor protein CyaY [Arsenophonus nasoniae]WGM01616.1 iron donor protein CyaY [Arsenophonus nasoniae]WGM05892.1 iron donor protein CyaY [Arsenophonus nasoniae]WGM10905.1 iron donor protein CyaY [Arsenophonus nasoniae]